MAAAPRSRPITDAEFARLTDAQRAALGLDYTEAAPADFGGTVLANPNHVRPFADTDPLPATRLPNGVRFLNDLGTNAKFDVSSPAAAQIIAPAMQTVGAQMSTPAVTPDQDKLSGDDLAALTEAYRQMKDSGDARAPKVAAYIQNIVRTGNHGPMDPVDPDHAGFWKTAAGIMGGALKAMPAMFETPGINPGTGELTTGAAGRSQENVGAAAQADAERKARGESLPYRATATAASLATPANIPAMEQAAREGDIGAVAAHAVVPIALTAAPLVGEGVGRVARMPAIQDITAAKVQAIRDAGTKAVRGTVNAANTALEKAPGTIGGVVGAGVGGYFAGHYGAELGGVGGSIAGKELLPKLTLPGEHFGLPDRVAGGPATIQDPISLSQLNGAKPQITPKITPKAVETQISDALGGKPLQKNVPLRAQVPAAAKSAAAAQLPEGFTPALKADGTPSSALRGYKYDPATREFESISKDGSHYIHGDVSPEEVQAFENAESKGKAWNQLMDQNVRVAKVVNGKRMANPKAQPSGTPTEEAPGGTLQSDLTGTLQSSLKNIQNLPLDADGKPIRYVYRARDVGEEGVPLTNSHASATSDAVQAKQYAKAGQRAEQEGQVVRIDLSKLSPKDYVVKQHPDGALWIQFTRPLTESEVSHYAGASKTAGK